MHIGIKNFIRSHKALSIIEVLVAMTVFTVVGSSITFIVIGAYYSDIQTNDIILATQYGQQAIEAVVSIRKDDWNQLSVRTGSGTYGLSDQVGYWQFFGSNNTKGKFTRNIVIQPVYRSGSTGNIVNQTDPFAALDSTTLKIVVNVSWLKPSVDSIVVSEYVTDWQVIEWKEDVKIDFSDGVFNKIATSMSTGDGNGALTLTHVNVPPVYQCIKETPIVVDLPGTKDALDIVGSGNYIYISQDRWIYAYDISNPSLPLQVGSVKIKKKPKSMVLSGNYLYTASKNKSGELEIIEVTNPANLTVIGKYKTLKKSKGLDVAVMGNTAYLVTKNNSGGAPGERPELYIIDVTNKAVPVKLGGLEIGFNVYGITVHGSYAYLSTNDPGNELKIVDITDSTVPILVSSLNIAGNITLGDITYNSGYIFASSKYFQGEIYVVDVQDPLVPVLANTIVETGVDFLRVRVFNNNLFVGSTNVNNELLIYDITNPAVPIKQSSKNYVNTVTDVYVSGANIFVTSIDNISELGTFVTASVDNWICPTQKAQINLPGTANGKKVFVRKEGTNSILYMIQDYGISSKLYIYNVNNLLSPVLLGSMNIPSIVTNFTLQGSFIYMSATDDLKEMIVVDISNSSMPIEVGSFDATDIKDGTDIFVSGSRAYLTTLKSNGPEFYIIDITNPTNPVLADPNSTYNVKRDANSVVVSGNTAYIATSKTSGELYVLDISIESSINRLIRFDILAVDPATKLWMDPLLTNYLYLSNGIGNSMRIIDVSNPSLPVELSSFLTTGEVTSIVTNGNYAFMSTAAPNAELQIIDISNKGQPKLLSIIDNTLMPGNDLFFYNGLIYLANGDDTGEVKVIGRTEVGGTGAAYNVSGSYVSSIFDTGINAQISNVYWNNVIPIGCASCTIHVQLRTSPDNLGAPGTWTGWYGATGLGTFFTNPTSNIIPMQLNGNRWIQYRLDFTSDGSLAPILNNITVVYR